MDGLAFSDIYNLKKTFWISLPITIILSFISYFYFRSEYYQSVFYHLLLFGAIFMILIWMIWGFVYAIYLFSYEKIFPSLKVVSLLLILTMFFMTAHQIFFRTWLEREYEPQYLNVGQLNFTKPISNNHTYSSFVNLSFYNNLIFPLRYVEYDIIFTNWTVDYQILEYYPKERIIDPPSGFNMIFIRWKKILPYEKSFLTFNLSWDKQIGEKIPIDFSPDKTFIEISGYYVKCLPNEINNV